MERRWASAREFSYLTTGGRGDTGIVRMVQPFSLPLITDLNCQPETSQKTPGKDGVVIKDPIDPYATPKLSASRPKHLTNPRAKPRLRTSLGEIKQAPKLGRH